MNAPITVPLMTAEEFLALPDEPGVERWLDCGRVREIRHEDPTMTYRNRWHSYIEFQLSYLLREWQNRQPKPQGEVLSGEAGCILRHEPDVVVGIDVVYISAELAARGMDEDTTLIDGVPTLAVEILSPSDTQKNIGRKIANYLGAGVPLLWIVDPQYRTVTVYRPGAEPELFNMQNEISGEPHLPGFRIPVARIFER